MATKKEEKKIVLTRPQFINMRIKIEGITPYLPGKLAQSQIDSIEASRRGEGLKIKRAISPTEEREAKVHLIDPSKGFIDGNFGIPSAAFYSATKQAANKAYWPGGIDSKRWGIAVQIQDGLLPLEYEKRVDRVDTVIQLRVPKLDYRVEFQKWRVEVLVRFNISLVTQDAVLAVFDMAGTLGVGKWRPSSAKGGSFGTFKVVSGSTFKAD